MKRLLCLVLLCAGLGACATHRLSDDQQLQLYRSHAAPPQPSLSLPGSLSSWVELGDRALAVWTRPGEAYLLELSSPCSQLPSAKAISLTSRGGTVSARFDRVRLHGGNLGIPMACTIGSIQRLDLKALRRAEASLRR